MILGCDAVGTDADGNEVVVYPVLPTPGDAARRSILSEHYQGTLAERVAVPGRISAAAGRPVGCRRGLPADRLAHRLADAHHPGPGRRRRVGAGPGGRRRCRHRGRRARLALGKRVYATSRDAAKRDRIAAWARPRVEPGARLPERVDVVIETVGAATFDHSLKCAARWPDRGLRRDLRAPADGEPAPGLRHAAGDPRHLDGHPGRVDRAARASAPSARYARWSTAWSGSAGSTDAFARLHSGDVFGKVVVDHTA